MQGSKFRRGAPPKRPLEAQALPDEMKLQLCEELLEEFDLPVKRRYGDELIHGCRLPWAEHGRQDTDPTASLNYKKLTYKCLGCGTGGGLLWFIAAMRDISADEAREWLGNRTGTEGHQMDLSQLIKMFEALYNPEQNRRPPMPHYDERLLDQWAFEHPYFTDPPPDGRGIPQANVERLRLGYDPKMDRVVLPHFHTGQLVGWQSRRWWDDGSTKYLSSPDFPKDSTIYNYDPARPVVVVESMLSVARHEHHQHFEATFGATVTERQIRLLSKHPHVVLWMDNDKAGWEAVRGVIWNNGRKVKEGLAEQLMRRTTVDVVQSPWAEDPDDLPDEVVDELVDRAVPYSVWKPPDKLTNWKG